MSHRYCNPIITIAVRAHIITLLIYSRLGSRHQVNLPHHSFVSSRKAYDGRTSIGLQRILATTVRCLFKSFKLQ